MNYEEAVAFMTGLFTGAIIVVFMVFVVIDPDSIWHKNIVRQGHGEYNKTTGEFQFLPACNKEIK